MDGLPDEIVLYILSFLDVIDVINAQTLSKRFFSIARDSALWRKICYDGSYIASRRRRRLDQTIADAAERNSTLIRALAGVIGPNTLFQDNHVNIHVNPGSAETTRQQPRSLESRVIADWDPSYPREKVDFYNEYIQRHAPVTTSWFETVRSEKGSSTEDAEITGVGLLLDAEETLAEKVYAALDDGSIGVWGMPDSTGSQTQGRLVGRSSFGLLSGQRRDSLNLDAIKSIMTASAAIECVSLDHSQGKGYFAVQERLCQVDLETLQMISSEAFGDAISSISEARHPVPITVGTTDRLSLYDPRQKLPSVLDRNASSRLELIGGNSPFSRFYTTQINGGQFPSITMNHRRIDKRPAMLSEPGPLSILHTSRANGSLADESSIWVAGRFTSIINYDRRFFPKVKGSIHSGARISCLRHQPYPFRNRPWSATSDDHEYGERQKAKAGPGSTLLAAGEYKGKGSLELYGLTHDPKCEAMSSHYMRHDASTDRIAFRNRQTAGGTKILTATQHGGKYVYSDGDGNVKWVERDGFTPIRTWNINDRSDTLAAEQYLDISRSVRPSRSLASPATAGGDDAPEPPEDIVKLLLPTMPNSTFKAGGKCRVGEDNLVMWTGEGKIGLLGFGHRPHWGTEAAEEQAELYAENSMRKQEREYNGLMGRALRRQQDEINFMRSFGFQ